MSNLLKILSIDGGGIRGIISAIILAEIEKLTQKPISELFALIVGTSTGGILALGLTVPNAEGKPRYSAEDLIALYENEGGRIFSRSLWHKIRAAGNLLEEKYPSDGIKGVLAEYFGETRLKEALTEVLITSYEIEQRIPFFFKSTSAKDSLKTASRDFFMKQVARATSAAPTYFEPIRIETDDLAKSYALIDGGVFANNPTMCALVEAKTTFPDVNDFLVVSLGTGELIRPILYEQAREWGKAEWGQPLLSVVFSGINKTVDYQLH
ncbi:patatin [Hydrococcus rivularis NIES-593]|uniref:Patatin n=1 Tax=Hydrococcus rivularis NIES-593 TaxID=1921803 RepID=A0A1U7HBX0_9CYAN|nr:patatin-like phospholipase family protein [Hydrococcus rivularis]OKH21069.1 patatin [Hydrococcus rivularis NIES-593]